MMKKSSTYLCDLCLDVISGGCTDEERSAFERHLPSCENCQAEMDMLRTVWEVLPADMERIEPPADLKKQVLTAAFEAEKGFQTKASLFVKSPNKKTFRYTAAMLLFLFAVGTGWNIWLYNERNKVPQPFENALYIPAAQIEQMVMLKSQTESNEANSSGVAGIVDNGQSKQLVVFVFGAAPTDGEQAYQVWLFKNGVRQNAGTFRVADDDKGTGILSVPITSSEFSFDTIGITLEPDDRGKQPRGKKVFGST